MTFKEFLIRTFTWWNGTTWGTQFYTWRKGGFVGEDEFGNRYYEAKGPLIDPSVGPRRRWVIYNGEVDASKVPPGWRGWLAFTAEVAPSRETYERRPWELPHVPNNTGTPQAYRPKGSILREGERPEATGDYVPWSPDGTPARSETDEHSPHPGLPKNLAHG
jgi:NADH:ubiquinone oxidoreductase subunit